MMKSSGFIISNHTKFLDNLRKFILFINLTKTNYGIISTIKDTIDVSKVVITESPGTLKVISIYKYHSKWSFNITPQISIELETL